MDKFQYKIKSEEISKMRTKKANEAMMRELNLMITNCSWGNTAYIDDKVTFDTLSHCYRLMRQLQNANTASSSLPQFVTETVASAKLKLVEKGMEKNIPKDKLYKAFEFDNIENESIQYDEVARCLDGVYCQYNEASLRTRLAIVDAVRDLAETK